MTLGTGCNMHGHGGTSCRSRCVCVVMGSNSQHWRIQARSVNNALRFFIGALARGSSRSLHRGGWSLAADALHGAACECSVLFQTVWISCPVIENGTRCARRRLGMLCRSNEGGCSHAECCIHLSAGVLVCNTGSPARAHSHLSAGCKFEAFVLQLLRVLRWQMCRRGAAQHAAGVNPEHAWRTDCESELRN